MRRLDVHAWMPLLVACVLSWMGSADRRVPDAARSGDVEAVRAAIADGADVDGAHGDGMTGLHWAALGGNESMARVLIDSGASVGLGTRLGSHTPLHVAAKAGHSALVEVLVGAGADVSRTTETGATALHFAAAAGAGDAVTALLEAGADVDAREPYWGQTPLMFAAAAGRLAAVEALVGHGADVNVTARVVDLVERDIMDRAAQSQRRREIAAMRSGEALPAPVAEAEATSGGGSREAQAANAAREAQEFERRSGEPVPLNYADLVGVHGGLAAIHLAAREGHAETVRALLEAGVEIDARSAADGTTPMLIAAINGYFDLALELLEAGADPSLTSDAGAAPLFAVLNMQWAPKARHPQPLVYQQQQVDYLTLMRRLLEAGADPDARLTKTLWYTTYNRDLLGVDRTGATAFWRAAHATDVAAMRLLLEFGADPHLPTIKVPERRFGRADATDHSGLPPVPVGGPGVYPIHAAAGAGYGQGYAGNSHRHVPDGWMPAVRFLVEDMGADVNQRDHKGYTPVHHAASRGDNEMIRYLVEHGADVTAVARNGQTTVDLANGPVQRIQPFPETILLLEKLGAKNNHNCVSC